MGLTLSAVRLVNVRAGGAKAAAAPRHSESSKRCILMLEKGCYRLAKALFLPGTEIRRINRVVVGTSRRSRFA